MLSVSRTERRKKARNDGAHHGRASPVLRENGAWQRRRTSDLGAGRAILCVLDPAINDEQLDAVHRIAITSRQSNPLSGVQSVQRSLFIRV